MDLSRFFLPPGTYTADDVLEHVSSLMDAEPLRVDMAVFKQSYQERIKETGDAWLKQYGPAPACDTVGCLAGWSAIVAQLEDSTVNTYDAPVCRMLGLDYNQREELFFPDALISLDARAATGPRAHQQATLRHLQAFREKHKDQLSTHRVVINESGWVDSEK